MIPEAKVIKKLEGIPTPRSQCLLTEWNKKNCGSRTLFNAILLFPEVCCIGLIFLTPLQTCIVQGESACVVPHQAWLSSRHATLHIVPVVTSVKPEGPGFSFNWILARDKTHSVMSLISLFPAHHSTQVFHLGTCQLYWSASSLPRVHW